MFTQIQQQRISILTSFLYEIYSDEYLAKYLVFKGGTSLMLFYNLPRFSEDLDFSLIEGYNGIEVNIRLNKIIKKLGYRIENYENNKNLSVGKTCYYTLDGGNEEYELKLEVSNRNLKYKTDIEYTVEPLSVNNSVIMVNLLGLKQNFAHKMCAFFDRNRGRDTVDIFYYLKNNSPIDENVLFERLGLTLQETFSAYVNEISKKENRKAYLGEIFNLINGNDLLLNGYYLDETIQYIYNYGLDIDIYSQEQLDLIYDNIINNPELYQINQSFYVIRNNPGFTNYFKNQSNIYGIINFVDNQLVFETNTPENIVEFIKENQLLFN